MLDRLVESRDNGKHRRKIRGFLVSVGTVMTGLCAFGLVFSIFSTSLAMGNGEIELSRLVAPAMIPEKKPVPPEPIEEKAPARPSKSNIKIATRVQNIQRVDEVPVKLPSRISTSKSKFRARPRGQYIISNADLDVPTSAGPKKPGNINQKGTGFATKAKTIVKEKAKPIVKTKKTAAPPKLNTKKKDVILISDLVNGKAINLVKPRVTATIRSLGLRGSVKVKVLIGKNGRVISATGGTGHKLLLTQAIAAARRSTFSPTLLNGSPVKVRGLILYNFK